VSALGRETASADLLRVISSSPTDLGPVFETIVDRALRLCAATIGGVARYEGGLVSSVAVKGPPGLAEAVRAAYPRRLTDSGLEVRAIRERMTVHVADVLADPSSIHEIDKLSGFRAQLSVPMLKAGDAIGAVSVVRPEPGLFSDQQVKILETFAAQAVIAIENVRLFHELQVRNAELTESLEQQTATGEILQVIARSPTDLHPVMEAVVENAARVCAATYSAIWLLEGQHLRPVARRGSLRRSTAIGEPIPVNCGSISGRLVWERRTIHVEDIQAAEAEFPEGVSRTRQTGAAEEGLRVAGGTTGPHRDGHPAPDHERDRCAWLSPRRPGDPRHPRHRGDGLGHDPRPEADLGGRLRRLPAEADHGEGVPRCSPPDPRPRPAGGIRELNQGIAAAENRKISKPDSSRIHPTDTAENLGASGHVSLLVTGRRPPSTRRALTSPIDGRARRRPKFDCDYQTWILLSGRRMFLLSGILGPRVFVGPRSKRVMVNIGARGERPERSRLSVLR